MKLLELVKIDSRFEKSVNLTLDLYVQDKIDGYIPTRSSVNVLDAYINEVRNFSGNRATVLIGPYGKGKSHLLLVLLSILSQTCQMSAINKLVQRISAVNPDAAAHINDVMENQGQFLPVLINAGMLSWRPSRKPSTYTPWNRSSPIISNIAEKWIRRTCWPKSPA